MTTEQVLIEKNHILPEEKKAKVLEFVEQVEKETEATNGTETRIDSSIEEKRKARMSLVGIGKSGKGDVSQRVDEILAEGINKREGWSLS